LINGANGRGDKNFLGGLQMWETYGRGVVMDTVGPISNE